GGEEFGHTVVSRPSMHVPPVVCDDVGRPGGGAEQLDEHSVERLLPGGGMGGGGGGEDAVEIEEDGIESAPIDGRHRASGRSRPGIMSYRVDWLPREPGRLSPRPPDPGGIGHISPPSRTAL